MSYADLMLRLPQFTVCGAALVLSFIMFRRYPMAASFAIAGFTLNILQALFFPQLSQAIRDMFSDHRAGLQASNLVLNSLFSLQLCLFTLAIFVGRRVPLRDVKAPKEYVDYVFTQVAAGQSYDQIEASLKQRGLTEPVLGLVMNEVESDAAKAVRLAGVRNLSIGFALFGLGLLISVGSYLMAANAGGGKYMVTHGIIVIGAVQMVRGLTQLMK